MEQDACMICYLHDLFEGINVHVACIICLQDLSCLYDSFEGSNEQVAGDLFENLMSKQRCQSSAFKRNSTFFIALLCTKASLNSNDWHLWQVTGMICLRDLMSKLPV